MKYNKLTIFLYLNTMIFSETEHTKQYQVTIKPKIIIENYWHKSWLTRIPVSNNNNNMF